MTDLEITRLCAEAMKITYEIGGENDDGDALVWIDKRRNGLEYTPLHDDAQAMALVKRFGLNITGHSIDDGSTEPWCVWLPRSLGGVVEAEDLNRAICECAAKTQAAKDKPND